MHLIPGENTEVTNARINAVAGNSASTFVLPESVEEIESDASNAKDAATDKSIGDEQESASKAIEKEFESKPVVRETAAIADESWVDDSHTPALRAEVRGNMVRASDDLEYLKQLDRNDLCASQCQSDVVNRENQLRILRALDDQMTHGYAEVIPLESGIGNVVDKEGSGATKYLVTLQDARGETFYCNASGTCTPSDTFQPASPRRNPIAVVAAPVEVERAASRLSYATNPVAYAFAEISGSGANVFQQAINPSPAFSPRMNYPACSLLTSLIGACANWL